MGISVFWGYLGFNITVDPHMESADRAKYGDQNNMERLQKSKVIFTDDV